MLPLPRTNTRKGKKERLGSALAVVGDEGEGEGEVEEIGVQSLSLCDMLGVVVT